MKVNRRALCSSSSSSEDDEPEQPKCSSNEAQNNGKVEGNDSMKADDSDDAIKDMSSEIRSEGRASVDSSSDPDSDSNSESESKPEDHKDQKQSKKRHKSKEEDASDESDHSQCSKENKPKKKSKSPEEHKKIKRMKLYFKLAGIRIRNYATFWEGCKTVEAKVRKMQDFLHEKGLKGKPTVETCKKLRTKLETRNEVAELSLENIIETKRGRARRTAGAGLRLKSSTASPERKTLFSRIKAMADSDSD